MCDLAASGGLAATLQTDEHDDVYLAPFGLKGFLLNLEQTGQFLHHGLLDEHSEVPTCFFLIFELFKDSFSQPHDISDVNITGEESIAYFFEALLDSLLVDDCSFVELLQGSGDFSAELS